jgi:hypothetical protein
MTHFETLEEALQAFSTVIAEDRSNFWELGDIAAAAIQQFGARGTVKALAEVGRCTRQYVTIRRKCAQIFPPAIRYPDVDVSLYRACLAAADPIALLRQAVDQGLSARQVMEMLHPDRKDRMVRCPQCGNVFPI